MGEQGTEKELVKNKVRRATSMSEKVETKTTEQIYDDYLHNGYWKMVNGKIAKEAYEAKGKQEWVRKEDHDARIQKLDMAFDEAVQLNDTLCLQLLEANKILNEYETAEKQNYETAVPMQVDSVERTEIMARAKGRLDLIKRLRTALSISSGKSVKQP
jgi:hypothetical protein